MRRLVLIILLGSVAVVGCLGSPRTGTVTSPPDVARPGETPTASPSPTLDPETDPATLPGETPTIGETATQVPETTERGNVSVDYVVRADSIADNVAHVYVDFSVYFAEYAEDIYACTEGAPLFENKYDPTPTPIATPAGHCAEFDAPRVDITTLNGTQSLGRFNASARYSGGHTLVVNDVTVVLENGTTASDVYDTDFRAITEQTTPSGIYGIEFSVTDYKDSDRDVLWRYGIDAERFALATD